MTVVVGKSTHQEKVSINIKYYPNNLVWRPDMVQVYDAHDKECVLMGIFNLLISRPENMAGDRSVGIVADITQRINN